MSNIVIHTSNLTRKFGDQIAVNALSIDVQQGEIFGLLGHNGAGKTTTVRLLNGVLTPHAGEMRVLGLSPLTEGTTLRRRTGVLTETPSLYERLNARDNLNIFADLYGVPKQEVNSRIDAMLKRFELEDRATEKVGGYSKGMRQRLALARAFLHEPDILFLDEPTSGLDPVAAKQVNDLILHLSRDQGRTIILATHNLYDAQRLCDRVAVLEHGSVVAQGTPTELAEQISSTSKLDIEVDETQVKAAIQSLKTAFQLEIEQSEKGVVTLSGVQHKLIPDMLAQLVNENIRVYRVVPHEPSLEDVYFALHRAEESVS